MYIEPITSNNTTYNCHYMMITLNWENWNFTEKISMHSFTGDFQ